jgi:hypothetical protein
MEQGVIASSTTIRKFIRQMAGMSSSGPMKGTRWSNWYIPSSRN